MLTITARRKSAATGGSLTILIWILVSPLLLVNLTFLTEVLAGLRRQPAANRTLPVRDVIVLVPAHNEAKGIGATIQNLKRAVAPEFAILIVADNCTDDTATIARELGATVIERDDPVHRGKGYALAAAREWMRRTPPAAVVVLDADCRITGDSLRYLTGTCLKTNAPCQAVNLLEPDRCAGPLVQISTFAFLIKNLVRQRGLMRLTGGVHLTGTGMCLPWELFDRADLATSSIVEDLRLGIELSRTGAHTLLVEDSRVWSPHADASDILTQRSRWEGGFLALARKAAPELIFGGLRGFELKTVLRGLDLLIPPLALLALINVAALLVTCILAVAAATGWTAATVIAGTGLLIALALLAIWWREGRQCLSAAALVRLPLYVLWKIPMYAGLAKKGAPTEWLRTGRPSETDREV